MPKKPFLSLKGKKTFQLVFANGFFFRQTYLTVVYLKTTKNVNRIGISVGKKFGNAVARNRIKRVIRSEIALFTRDSNFTNVFGYDMVLIPKKYKSEIKLDVFKKQINKIFQQIISNG